jgi:hypothetical protein
MQFNQVTAGTATPVLVWQQVPGQGANVIFTNSDQTHIVYLGSSTAMTVSTGAPIPPYGVISLRDVVSTSPVYALAQGTAIAVGVFYGDLR